MSSDSSVPTHSSHHLRFHAPHLHLASPFGGDWFGQKAEHFARFFGTPTFLITQTVIVGVWIVLNAWGLAHYDPYPFILLNLAFSLQAAYAAPLILLAQTRQADRDKMMSEADASTGKPSPRPASSGRRSPLASRSRSSRCWNRTPS